MSERQTGIYFECNLIEIEYREYVSNLIRHTIYFRGINIVDLYILTINYYLYIYNFNQKNQIVHARRTKQKCFVFENHPWYPRGLKVITFVLSFPDDIYHKTTYTHSLLKNRLFSIISNVSLDYPNCIEFPSNCLLHTHYSSSCYSTKSFPYITWYIYGNTLNSYAFF